MWVVGGTTPTYKNFIKRLNRMTDSNQTMILISVLAADVIPLQRSELIAALASQPDAVAIAQTFGSPKLIRQLKLARDHKASGTLLKLDQEENRVLYQDQAIGRIQIFFKSPLPGELQARLAIESATNRFLEYLQKLHHIVVLNESDHHVHVFIPDQQASVDFKALWEAFLSDVAFSAYGNTKLQLPGLVQTFIVVFNTISLAERGSSTLDVPILTQEQSTVLAAFYLAVIEDVKKRQTERQEKINRIRKELASLKLSDQERQSKEKDLQQKEAKQEEEERKYTKDFQELFGKVLEKQNLIWQKLETVQHKLAQPELPKAQQQKLQKQQEDLAERILFSQESIQQKCHLLERAKGEPFEFIRLDLEQNPDKFKPIAVFAKIFTKTATEQINSSRGNIFSKVIHEMYRLLESKPSEPLPKPLLSEQPVLPKARVPGDDSREFCYSCGVALNSKTAKWKVARFIFERPSQRPQSAYSEERPHICASCSALAFASPLKVTDESIIIRLEPANGSAASELKVKDYIRMLTNKEMHLSAGRYLVLTSDRTDEGDLASQKLGQVQYACAKVASIFPSEVLADFNFWLVTQGSQPISLYSRHLIFIKGLMEGYGQSIVVSGKEINMALGDAVRYVEQDLPFLADYKLVKVASVSNRLELEQTRAAYWKRIRQDLEGISMGSANQIPKRAQLYKDVAALTGLTYAFAESLEITAKKGMKPEDVEREVSKLIEKVDDAVAFCYYATFGDEKKTSVEARLYHRPANYFVYDQTKKLLENLKISIFEREKKDNDKQETWLNLYADDVMRAYAHFAENSSYAQEKDWKELTYQLKLSLYTRFPELVRKMKSTSEK